MIKVCGLTRPRDVALCEEMGVDMLGFIFYQASPRAVDPGTVAKFPRGRALRVGVFVDASSPEILRTVEIARLDMLQLHGREGPDLCRSLGKSRVIKTLWPERHGDKESFLDEVAQYRDACAFLLVDAGQGLGGHGRPLMSWPLSRQELGMPWLLAGGLEPGNISALLATHQAFGIDLNSGVELCPGYKDPVLIKAAVKEARGRGL